VTDVRISVVVAARDAASTLGECLKALANQSMAAARYEVLVVVDQRSTDETERIARDAGVRVVTIEPDVGDARFTAGSRNAGIRAAHGEWVAFTDADCVPSRAWLRALLSAAEGADDGALLAVAGLTLGLESGSPPARYVDITGGLRAERHLDHPLYPWPPAGNVMYRRAALLAVGGYDQRFASYEQADLHLRLIREVGGSTIVTDRALVFHRHRSGWRAYARQQRSYGTGYAQFYLRYRDELIWSAASEVRAWLSLVPLGAMAALPAGSDGRLVRRGDFVKRASQRVGFARTYWNPAEAARWKSRAIGRAEVAPESEA
jgi:glycosyltransferase involved in cell wall biosynthesis